MPQRYTAFLAGDGEMKRLTREKDWSQTSLGPIETWPQSLRLMLGVMLNSKFPMFLFWGPELLCFYNDAYRPSMGNDGKHPSALGAKAEDVWKEIWTFIKPIIDQVLLRGESNFNANELLPIYRNGRLEDVYWTFSYTAVFDEAGLINGVFVTCVETTGEVQMQKQLAESERKLRLSILQAPVSIGIFRGKELITEIANGRALSLWGRTEEEILNRSILEALPELRSQGIDKILADVYHSGKTYVAREMPVQILRNGKLETSYINFSYEPLYDNNDAVNGIMAVGMDVTEQVLVHQKIEESEAKLRQLAGAMPQLVWISKPDGTITFYNQRIAEFAGATALPDGTWTWDTLVHPQDIEFTDQVWKHARETGEVYNVEHRIQLKNGDYRWFLSRAFPQRDTAGNIICWYGTATDIHEQKTFSTSLESLVEQRTIQLAESYNQLQKKNEELLHMNQELQSFAYVSSHDLQEPLRKIQAFSDLILRQEGERISDNGQQLFRRMQLAAGRMQTLIEDLLAYSRTSHQDLKFEHTDLNQIVQEIATELADDIQQKGAKVLAEKICSATVIPFQFRQLMYNLMSNALKFADEERTPEIIIAAELKKDGLPPDLSLNNASSYCHIVVTDNGIGFDPQYNDKIFQLFQRLHGRAEYAGTGIGLAIVKKIVDNHKGFITAQGNPGAGARFDIYLPVL